MIDRRGMLQLAGGAALLPWLGGTVLGQAATDVLRVALAAAPGALDPQFHNSTPNSQIAAAMFDTLTAFDAKQTLIPSLATAWRSIAPTTWEFTLRPGVMFSDGSPLTVEDIVASYQRIATLQTPIPFTVYTRSIAKIEKGDEGKLLIHTTTPDPLLPSSATRIRIIKAAFKDTPPADFNRGVGAIGTGPFVFKEYAIGSRLVVTRNDRYWGAKQSWREVVVNFMSDKAARTASLISGGVDLIEAVSPADLPNLKNAANVRIESVTSNRLIYFSMDTTRDVSPFITELNGSAMMTNPFKDLRVRQALSFAINREAIASRIMDGQATPASQFVPFDTSFGADPTLKPTPYNLDKAKALLAEAGFGKGFKLVMHSCNDRYLNDSGVSQAVAQMLSRIGIQTSLEIMPWSVYSKRTHDHDFSFCLGSWGANTGEAGTPLLAIVATPGKGSGQSNYGNYRNPKIDEALTAALSTMDDEARRSALSKIVRMAVDDVAVIPVHFEKTTWATAKDVAYSGRSDQYTLLSNASKG